MAEDCMFAAQAEVGELLLAAGGGSSTLPQKRNPVQAETLVSLFQLAAAQDGAMTQALLHRQQRDGGAWMLEWHALPQICMACGRGLQLAISMVTQMQAVADRMRTNLEGRHGLVYAEAISLRLAAQMPRGDAQARVKQLCVDAIEQGASLPALIAGEYPDIDWKGVKGVRDIISHHYFDLDAEEIFDICETHLPPLHATIKQMILDLQ